MSNANLSSGGELIDGIIEVLNQGEVLLMEISNENYTCTMPLAFNASIGGHYRHCLDHFRNLLASVASGELNYDQRQRGTVLETDRFAALNATRQIRSHFELFDSALLQRSLSVTCKSNYSSAGSQASPSSVSREVMYCVAHTVHHFALIGIIGALIGIKIPPGFGVAPSTMQHQKQAAQTA